MFERVLVLAVGGVLVSGCSDRPPETQDPMADPIQARGATDGIGYDLEVPQEASRKMLGIDESAPGDFPAQGPALGPHPDPWLSMTGVSGSAGSFQRWSLYVPAGKSKVTFKISGGTGDVDLYVNRGTPPTTSVYQCRPNLSGNNETCTILLPQEGTYHVGLYGYSAYSGVSLTGTYDDPPLCPPWPWPWRWPLPVNPAPPPPWPPIIDIADSIVGHFNYWTLDVPSGQSVVTFTLSGGTGDADLYVNFGTAPTTTTYQCRPDLRGNNETCTLTAPSAGTYFVGLRAYSAYSGVTLTTTYTAGP
ncbi:hypothetical protein D7X32_33465 [Corallococcus carmarthensis]|uniref:Peptidase C-terminal archaeal/bacterial domain-containing protein n=2 Tax=Corallococcus carmarthensis TaxID=2316728 RepID=A0A3A8JN35_9BACT|nr:hypothetical protein D7X32_33465 [Corallococcus carmarthensis]